MMPGEQYAEVLSSVEENPKRGFSLTALLICLPAER